MKELYRNIKQLRIAKGYRQEDVAQLLGYKDRSMIAKIEAGKVDITVEKVNAFADLFGVDPVDLMGWREDDDAAEIVAIYNSLNREGQNMLYMQAKMLRNTPEYSKKSSDITEAVNA